MDIGINFGVDSGCWLAVGTQNLFLFSSQMCAFVHIRICISVYLLQATAIDIFTCCRPTLFEACDKWISAIFTANLHFYKVIASLIF
jgi:hypothetical protein